MASKFTEEDDALLEELGVEAEVRKAGSRTPREERIIAGFEEIQRFVDKNGRAPQHGEDRDIFERLYAVRLDRLRELDECKALVEPMDHQGLLTGHSAAHTIADEIDDDELLAQLGVDETELEDITTLRHVRSAEEKRAAEEIANRQPCEDFDQSSPRSTRCRRSWLPACARRAASSASRRSRPNASTSSAARRRLSPGWKSPSPTNTET